MGVYGRARLGAAQRGRAVRGGTFMSPRYDEYPYYIEDTDFIDPLERRANCADGCRPMADEGAEHKERVCHEPNL